jgi:hypothetical protein
MGHYYCERCHFVELVSTACGAMYHRHDNRLIMLQPVSRSNAEYLKAEYLTHKAAKDILHDSIDRPV